jgi:ABC-type dipeptide/oligopeptide/nickel transport system permease component
MTGYLLRRVGQALIVVVLVSLIVFVLLRRLTHFNHEQGFDRPIPLQYASYAGRVLQGDPGHSYRLNQNVVLITERLPKTLLLTVLATLFGLLIALPLGIFQAVRRNKVVDYVAGALAACHAERARTRRDVARPLCPLFVRRFAGHQGDVQLSGHGSVVLGRGAEPRLSVLLGVVLVISVATVVGSLLADLGSAWLDPRVRYSS